MKPKYNKETRQFEFNNIPFDGHFIEWKLEYNPKTYLKESYLSGDEWRKGGSVKIYMNGECVLEEFCREPERALMLLSKGLHELQCFFEPLGINTDDWQKNIIGKKIRLGSIPSTIIEYCGNGEIIVIRDDGKDFIPDLYPSLIKEDGSYNTEWGNRDRIHITDQRICWNIKH